MGKYITQTNPNLCILDKNTGEIIDYKETKKVNLDTYIMCYFCSIPELMELQGSELKFLMCLWKLSTCNWVKPEFNMITNNKMLYKSLQELNYNVTENRINVLFNKLTKKEILIRLCRGTYALNPKYFFKGTLSNRTKLQLSLIVEPQNFDNSK